MNLDDGAVDHGHLHVGLIGQAIEHTIENTCARPIPEPAIDRVPVPEAGRQVAQWRPRARDPEHSLHEETKVAARAARM